MFFLYEEYEKKCLESRWDYFLATLVELDENLEVTFPSNINFISWNYDNQVNIAFNEFCNKEEYQKVKPELVHLNGNCDFVYYNDSKIHSHNLGYGSIFKLVFEDFFKKFQESLRLTKLGDAIYPTLKFAWETKIEENSRLVRAKELLSNSDVIVVIGYSFPIYNRKIDGYLLQGLDWEDKEIVIQVGKSFPNVKSKILGLLGDVIPPKISEENQKETFYIPSNF